MKGRRHKYNAVPDHRSQSVKISVRIPNRMQSQIERIVAISGEDYSSVIRSLIGESLR